MELIAWACTVVGLGSATYCFVATYRLHRYVNQMPQRYQISVRGDTYGRIQEYCKKSDITVTEFTERMINDALDKERDFGVHEARLKQVRQIWKAKRKVK